MHARRSTSRSRAVPPRASAPCPRRRSRTCRIRGRSTSPERCRGASSFASASGHRSAALRPFIECPQRTGGVDSVGELATPRAYNPNGCPVVHGAASSSEAESHRPATTRVVAGGGAPAPDRTVRCRRRRSPRPGRVRTRSRPASELLEVGAREPSAPCRRAGAPSCPSRCARGPGPSGPRRRPPRSRCRRPGSG